MFSCPHIPNMNLSESCQVDIITHQNRTIDVLKDDVIKVMLIVLP